MVQHCDFVEQPTTTDGDGRVLRPDVVVNLPGGKRIVVDSKAPLAAYLDAFATDVSDEARQVAIGEHARHVREHILKLGQKAYWRQIDSTPEFVVMFLPDESFLRVALEHDPSLVEFAMDNNVIPASPTNLIGLLRAVHYGWQQETIADGAREISELGRELYKRLSTMGAHFSKLGRSLDGAVRSFNETVGSLERQVLPQARRFEQHGITGIAPPDLAPSNDRRASSRHQSSWWTRFRRSSFRERQARPSDGTFVGLLSFLQWRLTRASFPSSRSALSR